MNDGDQSLFMLMLHFYSLDTRRSIDFFFFTFGWVLIQLSERRRDIRLLNQGYLREQFVSTHMVSFPLIAVHFITIFCIVLTTDIY